MMLTSRLGYPLSLETPNMGNLGSDASLGILDLSDLGTGAVPAITQALGNMLAEAAGVCLESQGHMPGAPLMVRGYINDSHVLVWPTITEQALRAWNDLEYTTHHGAAGIAVLLADRKLDQTVIEASRKGTGIDYWLGDESDETFQHKARLEVSGIRRGDDQVLRGRVRQKLRQTDRSDDSGLPAYIIVVEFGRPLAEVREK